MSTLTYLTTLVQQAISRLNNYEANAKKVGELPHQTNLNTASKIPIERAGISEYITVDQIASAIQNGNYNQLLAIGAVSVNELTNEITVASGVTAQINGSIYQTTTDTTIPITLCPAGFSRKDILVLTTSNTVIAISGEETDGAIVLAPPVPIDAIYITEFDVNDTAIGTPSDPILGTQFKKKIENTRYKSKLSGENVIIPFQAAGQSHYMVTHAALVSVAGFTTAVLTTPMYEGQDVIFENQTGHDITLKASFGVDTSFVIGADLIVPNNGKLWFRFRNNELELIQKNWFGIQEVVTPENLGKFIDGLDSKTDVKDTDEFVLSDSDDELKSKKTRFLDLKTKLKSYFDTFYLSLSIFNDFVTDVFDSLDNKLDKSTTASSVYGTNTAGGQTMIPFSTLQPTLGFTPENVANKATNLTSPDDTKYPTTLAVVNENKKATITVELINQLTTDFYAPNALRINSTALISGSGTITLKVNDVAYTLGNLITQGAKITVETTSQSVYNLISIYE